VWRISDNRCRCSSHEGCASTLRPSLRDTCRKEPQSTRSASSPGDKAGLGQSGIGQPTPATASTVEEAPSEAAAAIHAGRIRRHRVHVRCHGRYSLCTSERNRVSLCNMTYSSRSTVICDLRHHLNYVLYVYKQILMYLRRDNHVFFGLWVITNIRYVVLIRFTIYMKRFIPLCICNSNLIIDCIITNKVM